VVGSVHWGVTAVALVTVARRSFLWWLSLRNVYYARNFNYVSNHTVNNDEGKRWHRHLRCFLHASLPAQMREGTQRTNLLVDCADDSLRRGSFLSANEFNDVEQFFRRGR